MPAGVPDPVIIDYIRANRGEFSRDEIVRELRLAGHEEAEIAAAWAVVEAEDPPASPVPEPAAPQVVVTDRLPVVVQGPFAGRDPAIGRYIRENRAVYTRPAITASLLEAGHSREDIEATWAEIAAAEARPPLVPQAVTSRRAALSAWEFWLGAVVTFVGLLVVPYGLFFLFPNEPIGAGGSCLLTIMAGASGLILLAFEQTRNLGLGLLAGIGALLAIGALFTLCGFIFIVVIIGVCVAIFAQSGTGP
jgi:hypothetical protein